MPKPPPFWPPERRRRRKPRVSPLMIVGAVVLILSAAVPQWLQGAGQQASGETIEVRADFTICHEGGGTNCVVDGDTVWIAGQKVRIAGIDAPETHEPRCPEEARLGKAATESLQAMLNSGRVTAKPADRDRDPNGRLLRHVSVEGRDAGQALVAKGLARAYRGVKKPWC